LAYILKPRQFKGHYELPNQPWQRASRSLEDAFSFTKMARAIIEKAERHRRPESERSAPQLAANNPIIRHAKISRGPHDED
jgi:hypothetical protein